MESPGEDAKFDGPASVIGKSCALIAVIFLTSFNCGCEQMGKETAELGGERVFIDYRSGGGRDLFRDGDRYGHRLEVTFTGNYILYRLLYRGRPGDSSIDQKEIKRGALDRGVFNSLRSKVSESDFSKLPRRLPEVGPHEAEYRTPARTVQVSIRPEPGEEAVTVKAHMAVDREYYPEFFLDLYHELNEISRELLELNR